MAGLHKIQLVLDLTQASLSF